MNGAASAAPASPRRSASASAPAGAPALAPASGRVADGRVPDFLFIGPDKSGSTWLYEMLRRHPDCWVPPVKDLYFFDRFYDRGLDWYLSHFADAPAEAVAVGELSHDYLFSPEAARRIARDLPGVRLITCLRHPVERTFSHYLYMVRNGRVTGTLREALARHPELIGNSLYASHLSVYLELFPRERLKVLRFERLREDAREFAREAFRFLGLRFVPDLPYEERVLPAGRPRVRLLARAAKVGADAVRSLGLARTVGITKGSRLVQRLLYQPFGAEERPWLPEEERRRLEDAFRADIVALQDLLSLDFGHWLRREDR